MLNYKNDSLLLEKLIFLNKEKQILNFFSALIKKEDFIKKDKISQPLQRTAYVKITSKLIKQIRKKYMNKEIIKITEGYIVRRSNLNTAINRWFENKTFPLITLRAIYKEKLYNITNEIEYFTDFLNKSRFYFPKTLSELLNKRLIYFIGCSVGDGHIDKAGKRWILVDGSSYKEKLVYSKEFVLKLSKLLQNYINTYNIRYYETKYVLSINNKLFCRFLNFFFELPFGKKKDVVLKKPLILKFSKEDLEKYFWRGLFDTDGSVIKQGSVNFCSSDKNLLNECRNYLNKINIKSRKKEQILNIYMKYLNKFAHIGLSHPRKQKELLNLLKKGLTYKSVMIKDKTDQKLLEIYKLLRIDSSNYRIRIHKTSLNKSIFNEKQIKQKIKDIFDYELKNTTKGLLYFKSKKVYEYLDKKLVFDTLWKPIKRDEEEQLLREWNKIWS